jgi:AcrR family transcriptional regulator
MPRPRARLDQSAIAAAFAPDGLHGSRAEEIARQAGIAKPTLYAHGRSKDAVFLACVESAVERLLERLYEAESRTSGLTGRHRVGALALAVIEHGREDPAAARLLHATARHRSSSVAAQVDAALARLPVRIAAALRDQAGADRAEKIAVALLGAAGAFALDPSPEALAGAPLLAEAFAAVLAAAADVHEQRRVDTVDVY